MRAGDLDQEVVLKSVAESNVDGEMTRTITTVATVWARVISEKGNEAFESARTNARETVRIGLRYRTDLDNKWIIVWEGQSYEVVNTDRSQRRTKGELWVTAKLVGAL